MTVMEAVRARIKELRGEEGLTVSGLAALCGISQSTMDNIVNGRYKSVTLSSLQKICDGLEIDLPTFFGTDMFLGLEP